MIETLTLAIGIGLAVSLVFTELFGLAAGGMVVRYLFALARGDEYCSIRLMRGYA